MGYQRKEIEILSRKSVFGKQITEVNKLKELRAKALHADFNKHWEQKDYKTIVSLSDTIPQNILLEDEQLLMYYDITKDRL